jgi:putative colanic acid biosynthesis acetyltransferase WcaF
MVLKEISELDLSRFKRPQIAGDPSAIVKAVWYIINVVLFRSSFVALLPSRAKVAVLRRFGAKIGRGVVIKPRVDIKAPWHLEIGDHVWIGENVWIDNHTTVRVGSNVCISQGVYIFTGNHDWSKPEFPFFCSAISIGDSVWITAFSRIKPGSDIPRRTVVLESST